MSKVVLSVSAFWVVFIFAGSLVAVEQKLRTPAQVAEDAFDTYLRAWAFYSSEELRELFKRDLLGFTRERFDIVWRKAESIIVDMHPEGNAFVVAILKASYPWGPLIVLKAMRLLIQDKRSIVAKTIITLASDLIKHGDMSMIPMLARPDFYSVACAMKRQLIRPGSHRTQFFFNPLVRAIEDYRAGHMGGDASAGAASEGASAGAGCGSTNDMTSLRRPSILVAPLGVRSDQSDTLLPQAPRVDSGIGVAVSEGTIAGQDVGESQAPVMPDELIATGDNHRRQERSRLIRCLQYLAFSKCCKSAGQ